MDDQPRNLKAMLSEANRTIGWFDPLSDDAR